MSPLRLLAYAWAFPTTMLGLLFVPESLLSGQVRWVDQALEVHGRWARFFLSRCTLLPEGASAMTLGHVILCRDSALPQATRIHEHVHVRQCERWGPLFIPAYLSISALLWLRGREWYDENPFEREAFGKTE